MGHSPDFPDHRSAFVLAAVAGCAMIVNRLDYAEHTEGREIGVGFGLLERGHHEPAGVHLLADIAASRRETAGPGVIVIDGGANIGTYTIPLANFMTGWGSIAAMEPQQWPFYALCGNIALNNCFNATASRSALAAKSGTIQCPNLIPDRPVNFGGTSLIEPAAGPMHTISAKAIDDFALPRLDIIKLDIEGMEPDALDGARETIERCKPVLLVEWIKCGNEPIVERLPNYQTWSLGMELLCVHNDDPLRHKLQFIGKEEALD